MPCDDCEHNPFSNNKNKGYWINGLEKDYCLLFGKTLELREDKKGNIKEISKQEYEKAFIEGFKERILRESKSLKKKLYHDSKDEKVIQKLKCLSEDYKNLEALEKQTISMKTVKNEQSTLKT